MIVFRYRVDDKNPAHTYVSLFAGPDAKRLALSGQLCFRNEEFGAFADAITEYNERVEGGDPRHIIEFREDGWTIKHPLSCRPDLFNCLVTRAVGDLLFEPPDGLYECSVGADGAFVVGAAVTS